MPMFSDNFREQVRAASDIVDVIGGYLPLKRAGANFVTLCPFHKEKSPSFNVNPGKQIFHCFGCHKGGDVFRFVQDYENLTFPEAVQRLAERAHIPLEYEDNPAAQQARGLKDSLLKLHEAICARWQQCLANEAAGQVARDYLAKRGVSAEAVKEFRLGAAPEAWDDTVNWAKAKGFDLALCEQAGLVLKKEETGRHYDRFRGRLMFPICDEQGRVIAFSGRVLQGDEKTAKYVNSPETLIFTKGRVLYALDKAKRAILDAGHAVVCEGQLDTIACHAAGLKHVVAPQGTALTTAHARILRRYTDDIILCFDGDNAGRRAAARAFDDLLEAGIPFRVASIPPPDDPDSFIKSKGSFKLQGLLTSAQEFHEFYVNFLCSQHDPKSERGRKEILRLLREVIQKSGSPVVMDSCAQLVAQRMQINPDAVRKELSQLVRTLKRESGNNDAQEPPPEAPDDTAPPPRPGPLELWFLKLLLQSPELAHFAAEHLDPSWIAHPTVRRIAAVQFSLEPDVAGLLAQFEGDAFACALITETASEQRAIPEPEKQLADVILRLRNAAFDARINALTAQLADESLAHEDRVASLTEQQRLRTAKRQPLEPLG